MSLEAKLNSFIVRAKEYAPKLQTEAATKQTLILPFFEKVLGYNTSDPEEFVPEYTADIAANLDKVDYAICFDGVAQVFIEVKKFGEPLVEKHIRQLAKYFNTDGVKKIAILTDGVVYHFYTDLKIENIMDSEPFLVVDLFSVNGHIESLAQFARSVLDVETIRTNAAEVECIGKLSKFWDSVAANPPKSFVTYIENELFSAGIPRLAGDLKGLISRSFDDISSVVVVLPEVDDSKKVLKSGINRELGVFYIKQNGKDGQDFIEAVCRKVAAGYKVKKGSILSSLDGRATAAIKRRRGRAKIDNNNVLLEDIVFGNPGAAASFVLGWNANGFRNWKTSDGTSLGDFMNEQASDKIHEVQNFLQLELMEKFNGFTSEELGLRSEFYKHNHIHVVRFNTKFMVKVFSKLPKAEMSVWKTGFKFYYELQIKPSSIDLIVAIHRRSLTEDEALRWEKICEIFEVKLKQDWKWRTFSLTKGLTALYHQDLSMSEYEKIKDQLVDEIYTVSVALIDEFEAKIQEVFKKEANRK